MPLLRLLSMTIALAVAATAFAVPKKIMIQEFTATWCPHCANVSGGIHQLLQNDGDMLVGMMQHFADDYETELS